MSGFTYNNTFFNLLQHQLIRHVHLPDIGESFLVTKTPSEW